MSGNLYPLKFQPIFQERIWGGRNLAKLYHKKIPENSLIGESWEISDRSEAQSVIQNGPLAGKTLHWLMEHHSEDLLGRAKSLDGKFPLLVKILDAREKLSLQVHPPNGNSSGGDPKTEMWYITNADPEAKLYVGLRQGVTRADFERKIADGSVADCFHQVEVQSGDAMFLPSGRVHAIGAGLVIFEIQQNSDTTYRVFDWNRKDAHGQPRQLHVRESLESIDFEDFEPGVIRPDSREIGPDLHIQPLVEDPLFNVELVTIRGAGQIDYRLETGRVVGTVEGQIHLQHPEYPLKLGPGEFSLTPAAMGRVKIETDGPARFLVAQPG